MKNNLISFSIIFLFVIALFYLLQKPNSEKIIQVKIGGQDIKVDLALTSDEHSQGLSGRTVLEENEGLLFVFNKPDKYSFWMKDMNFPIDIIWISEDLKVVYLKKNALPAFYPESYAPAQDAKYVLEVISGFSEKNNLKVGDTVEFIY